MTVMTQDKRLKAKTVSPSGIGMRRRGNPECRPGVEASRPASFNTTVTVRDTDTLATVKGLTCHIWITLHFVV